MEDEHAPGGQANATPTPATGSGNVMSQQSLVDADGLGHTSSGPPKHAAQLLSPILTPTDSVPRPDGAPELLASRRADSNNGTAAQAGPSQAPGAGSQGEIRVQHAGDSVAPRLPDLDRDFPSNEATASGPNQARTRTGNPSEGVRRLSAFKIQELTAKRESLPIAAVSPPATRPPSEYPLSAGAAETIFSWSSAAAEMRLPPPHLDLPEPPRSDSTTSRAVPPDRRLPLPGRTLSTPPVSRRQSAGQPQPQVNTSVRRNSFHPSQRPAPLDLGGRSNFPAATGSKAQVPLGSAQTDGPADPVPLGPPPVSPMPSAIPLPPLSIPTMLQLELAGQRPSPLYIHHSYANDVPYESSAIKFERLKNFLLLPSYLERTIFFGALACLDAWLWTFTILPLRFCIAVGVLLQWWGYIAGKEVRWLVAFVWHGVGRLWQRGRRGRSSSRPVSSCSSVPGVTSAAERSRSRSRARHSQEVPSGSGGHHIEGQTDALHPLRSLEHLALGGKSGANGAASLGLYKRSHSQSNLQQQPKAPRMNMGSFRHRRTKSSASRLTTFHKADLLQGLVIVFTCTAIMDLDASRMYHSIRGQSAIKLYTIYNLLEIGDRLLGALGQDIFECLFSSETLSRNSSGRSKILLPFGMFLLALVYNIIHSVTLFYQVITLNVAINSYSNTLLTLLMSNLFVEIKGSVFKRIEKENAFQMACADIVERFQLWIMLLIIGMRNVVEVGGLSVPGAGSDVSGGGGPGDADASGASGGSRPGPMYTTSILPASFTIVPSWLLSGEVLSPFFIVLGSEMIVDWVKHAYVNKFNNIKPCFYSRILDILCKDYYTNAFVTPSLTRRLGLPLLPLSCLFLRASVQTYHMVLATHVATPIPASAQTSLSSVDSALPSPAIASALDRLDTLLRSALGRAVYGSDPYASSSSPLAAAVSRLWHVLGSSRRWTSDDAVAALTMVVVFLVAFFALLAVKLVLGMGLLRYSRDRYARMKAREAALAAAGAAAASTAAAAATAAAVAGGPATATGEGAAAAGGGGGGGGGGVFSSYEKAAAAAAAAKAALERERERDSFETRGKRIGVNAQVEIGEDRRRWIYLDDPDGLRKVRDRDRLAELGGGGGGKNGHKDLSQITRYEMVAKRIW